MSAVQRLYRNGMRLFETSKPVVAAVQGAAIGAGLGLALAADFRIASHNARFSASFVKLGTHPGFGLTCTLPRAIGPQRATLMSLTGRRVNADDALAWGLIEQIVELERLRAAAIDLAREIAENAPLAVSATRASLRADLIRTVRESNMIEFEKQSALHATEDYREGVAAVAARRMGNFVGR